VWTGVTRTGVTWTGVTRTRVRVARSVLLPPSEDVLQPQVLSGPAAAFLLRDGDHLGGEVVLAKIDLFNL
jgi:hypothetical protein